MTENQELVNKAYSLLNIVSETGKLRKGTNESTKAIERKQTKLVIFAEDVSPPEVVAHITPLCKEREIPCIGVPLRAELGKAAGLSVPTACVAIVDAGEGKKQLTDLVSEISKAGSKKPAEKKAQTKEKPAEEAPAEESTETPEKAPAKEKPAEEAPAEESTETPEKAPAKEKPAEEKAE
ncbi:TPA: 50S ribosomal protein L7ae [archaeon]|nr:50S ribosomal protein L7ae [Candidatus Undinarchaeales archaeon SRR5007147.bin71]